MRPAPETLAISCASCHVESMGICGQGDGGIPDYCLVSEM